jgi:CheY-like chemotaxis protein
MHACPNYDEIQEPIELHAPSDTPRTPLRSARILVVEDERHIARLLEFVLSKAGYALTICHSGEQALLEITKQKPDALVLDLILPGMTGLEFLQTVRGAPYSCSCVVVVLSSYWVEKAEPGLAEAGVAAFCSKPIAPRSLLRKLEELGIHASLRES